ncbi:MAG: hypothetical protein ABIK44_05975, partial [candidate division WOR-3 bacterium]
GKPVSWDGQLLVIMMPAKHRATAELLEANRTVVEETISVIAGRPAKFRLVFEELSSDSDPLLRRITGVFGEVAELKSAKKRDGKSLTDR